MAHCCHSSHKASASARVCECVRACAFVSVCMCANVSVCVRASEFLFICVCVCASMSVYMCVYNACVLACTLLCMYQHYPGYIRDRVSGLRPAVFRQKRTPERRRSLMSGREREGRGQAHVFPPNLKG